MAAPRKPKGSKSEKLWRDALMVAVNRESEQGKAANGKPTKKLAEMAEKTVEMAIGGDVAAIREIGDRMDGRAHQSVAMTAEITDRVVSKKPLSNDDWEAKYGAGIEPPKGNGDGRSP